MAQTDRKNARGMQCVAVLMLVICVGTLVQSLSFMMYLPRLHPVQASHSFHNQNQAIASASSRNATANQQNPLDDPENYHLSADTPQATLVVDGMCKSVSALSPVRERGDLGIELKRLKFTGVGVELGVQQGVYTQTVLNGWQQAQLYVQVDLWREQHNYKDSANVNDDLQSRYMHDSLIRGEAMVERGYVQKIHQCHNYTTSCASQFKDHSLDFVYVDARHDRSGVLEDLATYWPKLRDGGVFAGHDYVEQAEIVEWEIRNNVKPKFKQDWTVNFDGTRDVSGRVLRGAVDDFFGGVRGLAPDDLQKCPLQVAIAYWENHLWSSWMVRKPLGDYVCKPIGTIAPLRRRTDIGKELRRLGLSGIGFELGVCNGSFTSTVVSGWKQASLYIQADVWPQEHDYVDAAKVAESMVQQGFVKQVSQCRNRTDACVAKLADNSLDFVYIDAVIFNATVRPEQFRIILETLRSLWPKVREGGVLAGNNFDGARNTIGRVVKHVTNDFFGGEVIATDDLQRCPRQVTVTYRERGESTTWLVRK